MDVSRVVVSPMYTSRLERNENEKPKANLGENVQHTADQFVNTNSTNAKVTLAAGGILGAGFIAGTSKDKMMGLIDNIKSEKLKGVATKAYNGLKPVADKVSEFASKLMTKVKSSNVISKLSEELAPVAQKAVSVLKAIPGPFKIAAATVAGLILLKGTYDSGKIDQKFEDRVHLRHTLENE